MSANVDLHASMRPLADGQHTVVVTGETVGACLSDLIGRYPAIGEKLLDAKGALLRHVEIYVNEESAYPDELKKPIRDGDTISITLIISGG